MPSGTYKAEIWDVMQFFFSEFNDHQIHFVLHPGARLDESRLKRAVGLLADAFPLLRSRFVSGEKDPCWEDAGFGSGSMVFLKKAEDAEAELNRLLCFRTEERTGPQMAVFLVRSRDADALCVVINHMLCDAAGFKEILYLLCAAYSRLKSDPDFRLGRETAPRNTRQILNGFGRMERAGILLRPCRFSGQSGSAVFGLEGDESSPFLVTHTVARSRFLAARAFAKQRGATVNDMVLAAYLRALRQVVPGGTETVQCIVDLRKYLPRPRPKRLCNLTSTLTCDLGAEVGATFGDTLSRVKLTMDAEKRKTGCLYPVLLLEIAFRVMPYPLLKKAVLKAYRNPPLAMSNIGVLDEKRLAFDGIPAKSAFMSGSVKYRPYFQLAISTFRNELTLSAAFHGTRKDQEKIRRFLEAVDRELPAGPAVSAGRLN